MILSKTFSKLTEVIMCFIFFNLLMCYLLDGTVIKNLPANAGDTEDMGLSLGSGRYPGGGNGNPVFLPVESHGQSVGSQRDGHN